MLPYSAWIREKIKDQKAKINPPAADEYGRIIIRPYGLLPFDMVRGAGGR
jgi:hypothetical protein